jgi:hypothetical protein
MATSPEGQKLEAAIAAQEKIDRERADQAARDARADLDAKQDARDREAAAQQLRQAGEQS